MTYNPGVTINNNLIRRILIGLAALGMVLGINMAIASTVNAAPKPTTINHSYVWVPIDGNYYTITARIVKNSDGTGTTTCQYLNQPTSGIAYQPSDYRGSYQVNYAIADPSRASAGQFCVDNFYNRTGDPNPTPTAATVES